MDINILMRYMSQTGYICFVGRYEYDGGYSIRFSKNNPHQKIEIFIHYLIKDKESAYIIEIHEKDNVIIESKPLTVDQFTDIFEKSILEKINNNEEIKIDNIYKASKN
jgi:hypothetical protein